jgi:hypothetical protein
MSRYAAGTMIRVSSVELKGSTRAVQARAAVGEERERLWTVVQGHSGWGNDLESFARLRSGETAVVVFEPQVP